MLAHIYNKLSATIVYHSLKFATSNKKIDVI